MSRKYLKYIIIDFDDFPVGFYHGEKPCGYDEGKDECPYCEQEHYESSDLAMDRLDKGDFDIWDIMCTNCPSEDIGGDRFWEWECLVSRKKL